MNKKKQKKWVKFRHRVVTKIAYTVLYPYCRLKYGVHAENFEGEKDKPFLILYNHQTPFDQFFVGISFKRPIYYVATEDIFSNGWVSSLIRWLVAPIPIKKQTTDLAAVMNCARVAREGGAIAIAPEGNRTYSGKTEHINPAIASLAKALKLPIAIYRIEGGYGVQPRWSDGIRKGRMRAYVSEVIQPEEYAKLKNDEIMARIEKGLYVNEGCADAAFKSEKRAEYLERAIYVCPFCGFSKFESHGNEVECKSCGRKVSYLPKKELKGVGFDFPFEFVTQWYDYQKDFVNALDIFAYTESPIFEDEGKLSQVIIYKNKQMLRENMKIRLYGDRIAIDEDGQNPMILSFEEISALSVLGRNKLNIYHEDKVYQVKGDKRFNALKYVNLYYRFRNISRGDNDGKFLGL